MNVLAFSLALCLAPKMTTHTFTLSSDAFRLDGKPFQILSGEMHPARIPVEYWRHRIQMAKAMGLNTIAMYVFWNYQETKEGQYDFETGNKNIAKFLRIARDEGMWVLLRPGPYVCAEWDFGGIPPYLLRFPDIKVRCRDPRYLKAATRYVQELARLVRPYLVTQGGPILMVQIENEYGSYGNDRGYLQDLEKTWRDGGVDVPFYTSDGPMPYMLEAGSLPGAAVGLDSGSSDDHWKLAKKMNPGVPAFSSETYPGWLTHWGEDWAHVSADDAAASVKWLLDHDKSFNLYVVHGGTNFGLTAGANSGGKGYEPDVTSYDYDAPIDEQGRPTAKYMKIREVLGEGHKLPPIPDPIPTMDIPPVAMKPLCSVWDNLQKPVTMPQPMPFEEMGQNQGLILYRTTLIGHHSGHLKLTELHDYATVFLDGKYIGAIDRRLGESSIELPKGDLLEILVEGMGHINFAQELIDRKGITQRATLNGMTLMNWEAYRFPLEGLRLSTLKPGTFDRPGIYFTGTFDVAAPKDTFLDMSGYKKGYVWVNGHMLGRYWDIGPQKRLYCPGPWLRKGANDLLVLDLHTIAPKSIAGFGTQG